MKTLVRKDTSKFITKKRIWLINSLIFTVIMLCLAAGCIKNQDYSARLVFPVLTTVPASDTTATTAVSGGNISSDGGYTISARGVCCDTIGNPSLASPKVTLDGTGTGVFASNLDGLKSAKKYHVRAYATNSQGTSYGQDVSFTTLAK